MKTEAPAKESRTVFVIMPFTATPTRQKSDLNAFFETNLKERIEREGSLKYRYVVSRSADAFLINDDIITNLYRADIVLCDLSGEAANPNVMFELGIRLALSKKPVIMFREEHPANKPIFDVSTYYIHPYSPLQYKRLEDFLIKKLRDYEDESESYQSPVLGLLRTDPTVVDSVLRERAKTLLLSLHWASWGLLRLFGGTIADFLERHDQDSPPSQPEQFYGFLKEREDTLSTLPWSEVDFRPNLPPALHSFLAEVPLVDRVELEYAQCVNSFCSQYYNYFFASNVWWRKMNLARVLYFAGETGNLIQIVFLTILILNRPSGEEAQRLKEEAYGYMAHSLFKTVPERFRSVDQKMTEPRAPAERGQPGASHPSAPGG